MIIAVWDALSPVVPAKAGTPNPFRRDCGDRCAISSRTRCMCPLSRGRRHGEVVSGPRITERGDCVANCDHGIGRRRRLLRRAAGAGRRGCDLHRARRASGRHAGERFGGRGAGADPPAAGQCHRRSGNHRPGRYRAVQRQALGHRERGALAAPDHDAANGDHLIPERRAEGRHAARGVRRGRGDGRRRLHGDDDRAARRDRADRHDAAHAVRRIRRPAVVARGGTAGSRAEGGHQCRDQRRHPPRDLGKICIPGRTLRRDH